MSKSKKPVLKSFTLTHRVLRLLNHNRYDLCNQMCDSLRITKQSLNYHLKKLEKEEFVIKIFHGAYQITKSGKSFLEQLEDKKKLIRLENMRYKYKIHGGMENILEGLEWKEHKIRNNNVYHSKFKGYSLRMFDCKEPFIEITCKHWYGKNIHEIMWNARNDVEIIMYELRDKFDLGLGIGEESMKPDFAMPSKLAGQILDSIGASQVKSSKYVLNRSKGRNSDWEAHDIESAQLVLDIPFMIKQMNEQLQNISDRLVISRGSYDQHLMFL